MVQTQKCCSNLWSNAKLVHFIIRKNFVLLKFGCTLPNLANTCPHNFPFTWKTVEVETFIWDLPNICKLNVGIDASQFYPFSMCQDMYIGLGGATSLDYFLKAYKASETKGLFPYEWFDSAHKLENQKLPPYKAFLSKLRNNNPLDKDLKDYENLRSSELEEQ